ncbi:MAG: amino acid adenylation domain-containing protein [Chthoniobacteraceae bacterium]|nr:amino acid adenylation domain-containing protein [Chthoniobacteraceae bacterium]
MKESSPDHHPEGCIHQCFEAQARKTPDAVAAVFGKETLTYRELDRRANGVAHRLRALGVGPDALVGLYAERSLALLTGILGILKAGGAYLPFDPGYPRERLSFMIADAQLPLLLAPRRHRDALPEHRARVLCLEDLDCGGGKDAPPAVEVRPDHLAYVIYTSGSTGRPKGAMVTHRNAVRLFEVSKPLFRFSEKDVWALFHSPAFDVSVWEIWGALLQGGKLVIVPRETSLAPAAFYELLNDEKVTVLSQTPGAFRQLLAAEEARPRPARLSLRLVFLGGEPVHPHLLKPWFDRHGDQHPRVVVLYGITETTVNVTYRPMCARDQEPASLIGVPLPDWRVYLLDEERRPVPDGKPGEIYIAGAGVCRGYLNRPELTAQRFLANPLDPASGERWYKSGDLARRLPNGELEYLGRIDHQVKIRGFRVELGEIEAALAAQDGVAQAAVIAREYDSGDKRLCAYLVARPGVRLSLEPLREALKSQLPPYMVPAAFVIMDALPLNAHGKLDARALPAPGRDSLSAGKEIAPPETPREKAIAAIWRDLLRVDALGIDDDFFELGGHSLLAAQAVVRIGETLGVRLSVSALFEAPTVRRLAARTGAEGGQALSIPKLPPGAPAPLSLAQQRLWFLQRLEPDDSSYTVPAALSLRGPLDVPALERALNEIVRRHDVLRATFPATDDTLRQAVAPALTLRLPITDLSALPASAREAEVERRIAADALLPFDLATGPLVRAAVLRLGAEEHVLLLNLHHIIADGWSLGVLFKEWSAIYAAFCRGEKPPLPPLPIQYADFAAWQRDSLRGDVFAEQIAYWKARLDKAPPCELPLDHPRPVERTFRGAQESLQLSAPLARALDALCREEGATLFMTLLAAFKTWLARQTAQADLCIGAPFSMRGSAEAEGLIGFFINTLVLRTDLSGNPTFREALARVRETALGAYAHQDVPFDKLVEILQPSRSLNRTPLFQIFFNQLNFPEEAVAFPGVATRPLPTLQTTSKFDLTLYVTVQAEGIDLQAVYNAALFDAAHIAAMLRQLRCLLEQISADPDRPLAAYSLVTEDARPILPDPTAPLPLQWEGSIARRFDLQASRNPNRPAVSDPAGTWTYRQLQAAADGVARTLAGGGIRPGDLVAVYAHRGRALPAALLGVWKAGAAFLVLDPAYPPVRLLEYLGQAQPRGWLQLEAAGPLPEPLAAFVEGRSWACRAALPANGGVEEDAPPFAPVKTPADALAYLAFTSGSTARPKGIEGTHRPLSHFLQWHARTFGLGEDDRFSLLSGLSHDPLLRDLFTPLWIGATLVVPPPEALAQPDRLDAWLREAAVSVVHWTPALAQLLEEAPLAAPLASLRYAFFGGDVLTRREVAALQRRAPAAACVNFYGATETPQAMGFHRVEPGGEARGERVPLGRGIEGAQLLVLNGENALAGVGEPGEICIRTPYLSRGYHGEPEQTRARFATNPFTGRPEDRVYRTGDRGRVRPDGVVEYLGRADGQVKIRGVRVEPGEIEALLAGHPRVRRAHVRLGGAEKRRLIAYVIPEGEAGPDLAACLREDLRQRLPAAMVPADFVPLETLPLTPNGKVDAAALPSPDAGGPPINAGPGADAPADALEYQLQKIWEDLLGRAPIGVHENFFDLGGHSLLAARLFTHIQKLTGCNLPLAALFQTPTVAQLAALIRDGGWEPLWAALVPIRPNGEKPPLFLIHPVGGNVLGYRDLAGHLAPDLPIFGLQAMGLRGTDDAFPCVEAMAAHYLEEIRTVRPHGPYLLVGYSTGGVVAFEMAQQLRARGEAVPLLVLLDSPPSGHWQKPLLARLAGHFRVALRLPRGEKLRYLSERVGLARRRVTGALARLLHLEKPVPATPGPQAPAPQVLEDLRAANLRAFSKYRPVPYPGPVILIRAAKRHAFFEEFQCEPDKGWRPFAGGGLTVRDLPGDHGQMLGEPNVTLLARQLQEDVDAALADPGPAPVAHAPSPYQPIPIYE